MKTQIDDEFPSEISGPLYGRIQISEQVWKNEPLEIVEKAIEMEMQAMKRDLLNFIRKRRNDVD